MINSTLKAAFTIKEAIIVSTHFSPSKLGITFLKINNNTAPAIIKQNEKIVYVFLGTLGAIYSAAQYIKASTKFKKIEFIWILSNPISPEA